MQLEQFFNFEWIFVQWIFKLENYFLLAILGCQPYSLPTLLLSRSSTFFNFATIEPVTLFFSFNVKRLAGLAVSVQQTVCRVRVSVDDTPAHQFERWAAQIAISKNAY